MHTKAVIRHRIQTEIANDYDNSASVLTARAIQILTDAATTCRNDDYAECIADAVDQIVAAKPSMAGLGNAARLFAHRLTRIGPVATPQSITDLADEFIANLANVARRAAVLAARMVPARSSVFTCSYSSLALSTLARAHPHTIQVYVSQGEYEEHGLRMADNLKERNMTAEIVRESLKYEHFESLSMAIVGADSVTPEFVVNGSPSLELAQAIHGYVPFYVVCESIKFAHEVEVMPGYDRVPIELVAGIITEDGVIAPRSLERRISLD